MQTLQILPHPLQPRRFQIQCHQFLQRRLLFEDMTGLAAGGAAGVQHPLPGLEVEQRRRQLGGFILHADRTIEKTGQLLYIPWLSKGYTLCAVRAGRSMEAGGVQPSQIGIPITLPAIDPQAHRWVQVVGRADGFPVLRPVCLQALL